MYIYILLLLFFLATWLLNKIFVLLLYLANMNKLFFNTVYLSNIFAAIFGSFFILLANSLSHNIKKLNQIKLESNKVTRPNFFFIFQLTIDSFLFIFFMTIILFFFRYFIS